MAGPSGARDDPLTLSSPALAGGTAQHPHPRGVSMQIIDLSQDIYEGMKVYPGHLKTVTFQHVTHEETAPRFEGGFSFQTWGFMLNDNGPTHVDSFSHLDPDPGAPTIDQMPLDLFYGEAMCVDVSDIAPQTDITPEHIEGALGSADLDLRRGETLFFYTATFDRFQGTPRYLTDFPGLGADASQWLLDRG